MNEPETKPVGIRAALKILSWFCPSHLHEEIEGDLIQKFNRDVKEFGEGKAKRRLIWNVVRFFRPGILLRNRFFFRLNVFYMFKNYFQSAIRNMIKRKEYSLLSISGLTLGLTAFMLISLYVWHERSYDQFHVSKDRIFRIQQNDYSHGELVSQSVGCGAAVGKDLKDNFPEVQRFVRLRRNQVMLSFGEVMFKEDKVFFASEDFFKVFSIPLIRGVDSLALKEPFTMAVSETFAKKYFGEEDPIGKVLKNNGSEEYVITGLFKDVPENTHLQVDALFSFNSLYSIFGPQGIQYLTNWGWVGYPTYIELNPTTDPKQFENKLAKFIDLNVGKKLKEFDQRVEMNLQPLTSIHLHSHFNHEISSNGDGRTTDFLGLVAILILVMAWVNYINLCTARSMERAKEVGVRKVLGSSREQLISQFLFESLLFNSIAFVLAFLLVVLLLPYFSMLVGRQFDLSIAVLASVIRFLLGLFIFGVICSGLYPAFAISSFKPIRILKGKFQVSPSGSYLRKGLVLAQFVTSVVLIACTYIIYQQIQFMKNSPLGVDINQILVVHGPTVQDSTYDQRLSKFRK